MRYTPLLQESPSVLAPGEHIHLSEIVSALTFALDLTEGAVPGHNLRCCLLGMRLAEAVGLPQTQRASLFYALLLKDVGCSSNAARMTAIVGGDDRVLKGAAKLQDWTRPYFPSPRVVRLLWQETLPTAKLTDRLARLARVARTQHTNNRGMIALRCERGANIVGRLDMGPQVAEAVRHLDEHWDGSGYPDRLRAEQIPVLSRICSVAQNLEVFASADGPQKALQVLRSRRRTWFDPEIVWAAGSLAADRQLWKNCLPSDDVDETRKAVLDLDPGLRSELSSDRLDRICEVFADVVDAKSPFTFRHSLGVTEVAQAIASELGLNPERQKVVRRAALLHDLGKLGVPNSILDKRGKLTETEWITIRHHPELSGSILRRVPALRGVAMLAEEHHERLDGSGYPRRLTARDLSLESRVIALADTYAAMVEERPYRSSMSPAQALELLSQDLRKKFDDSCFGALEAVTGGWSHSLPQSLERASYCETEACIPAWQ
jgi:putative nucleotidyltransferase with HDIG domain